MDSLIYQSNFWDTLTSFDISLVESILLRERNELKEVDLQYQEEKVLTMLGMLYAHCQLFDKFIPIAKEMGTREWQRITILAEIAEKSKKFDLALSVYESCLNPGYHHDFLRKKYKELKNKVQQ